MALSENVGHLVYTVGNDLISIGARGYWVYTVPWCYESKSVTAGVRWTNVSLSMVLR